MFAKSYELDGLVQLGHAGLVSRFNSGQTELNDEGLQSDQALYTVGTGLSRIWGILSSGHKCLKPSEGIPELEKLDWKLQALICPEMARMHHLSFSTTTRCV